MYIKPIRDRKNVTRVMIGGHWQSVDKGSLYEINDVLWGFTVYGGRTHVTFTPGDVQAIAEDLDD